MNNDSIISETLSDAQLDQVAGGFYNLVADVAIWAAVNAVIWVSETAPKVKRAVHELTR
jgi:hypothetical protein